MQALRVNVRFGPGSPNPSIPLFFGKFWGIQNIASNSEAVAAHFDQDIVLCLDRSHSMCFDLSGQDWEYPPETRRRRGDPYLMKPGAQNSRWAALQRGVDVFVEEVEQVNTKPQVALVTWASEIRVSNAENLPSPYLSPRVTVEEEFTTNFNQLSNKTKAKGGKGMMGGTDMSSGIRAAMERFGLGAARPLARKTIILMTDGQWNMGTNPVDLAREAAGQGITIHTLTFLDRGATTDMIEIAKVTGGKHFHANDEAELQEAFRELARLLPVVLTE